MPLSPTTPAPVRHPPHQPRWTCGLAFVRICGLLSHTYVGAPTWSEYKCVYVWVHVYTYVRACAPSECEVWQAQTNAVVKRHHGGPAFLRRWGVLVGKSKHDNGPLRIGPLSDELRGVLAKALRPEAHAWVASLRFPVMLEEWVQTVEDTYAQLLQLQLPGMSRDKNQGYHLVWTIRGFLLALGHAAGREVQVAPTDPVDYFRRGFPDVTEQINWLEEITGAKSAQGLLNAASYMWGAEFFTMDLCLAKPAYKWSSTDIDCLVVHTYVCVLGILRCMEGGPPGYAGGIVGRAPPRRRTYVRGR